MDDNSTTREQGSVRSKSESFARWAAKVSPAAPLIAWGFNALSPEPQLRASKIIAGIISLLIIVAGLVLAFFALRGVRKHGKKGIRGPAIAGLAINGIVIIVSIVGFGMLMPALRRVAALQNAGYTRAEMEAMVEVIPGSHKILDETIGFRLEIPGDFTDNSQELPPETLYSFFDQTTEDTSLVVNVCRLGGRIFGPMPPQEVAAMRAQLPAGSTLDHSVVPWKTYDLDMFTIHTTMNGLLVCTHVAQVPLSREAIQINVASPDHLQLESRALLALLLESLQGLTQADAVERLRQQRESSR